MNLRVLIFVLCALPGLDAQVNGTASLIPHAQVKKMLGARMAGSVSVWVVSLENASPDYVSVADSAVLRKIPQLQPFDSSVVSQLVADASQFSILERIFRVSGDASAIAGFLGTGKVVHMSNGLAVGLTAAEVVIPYFAGRIKGLEVPTGQRVQALSWQPVLLAPGASATVHVFTAPWGQSVAPVTFVLDTARLQTAKVAQ